MRDLRQTSNGDIDLSTGDLVLTDATFQHQRDILITHRGELKSAPTSGAGIMDYMHDENPASMVRAARKELSRDGQKVNSIRFINGELDIDATY